MLHKADGDAIFMTHALSPQEEADYLKRHTAIAEEKEFPVLEDIVDENLRLSMPAVNSDFIFRHSTSFRR
ncbi:MAG: hypothetical protein ACO1NO_10190 [Burkholderiaceae bacterium]